MIHHPREDNFVFKLAEAQYMALYLFSHRITVITILQHCTALRGQYRPKIVFITSPVEKKKNTQQNTDLQKHKT